jgi:hypothetical protein
MRLPHHLRLPSLLLVIVAAIAGPRDVAAQSPSMEQATGENVGGEAGFSNTTEFSVVATYGNSDTATLGLGNVFRHRWERARFTARFDALRSTRAEERFVEVIPNEGGLSEGFTIELRDPGRTLELERYLIEASFDRDIGERTFWNVGASWDRNGDAGIVSRYVFFTGLGTVWWGRDDLRFESTYGISYTDREEEDPDPRKEPSFFGARAAYDYRNKWGEATTFRNNARFNVNVEDVADWSGDMTTALQVALNDHVALQASVQLSYNNEPALRVIEVLAIVTDDAFINFGTITEQRDKLDTVLTSSLVLDF